MNVHPWQARLLPAAAGLMSALFLLPVAVRASVGTKAPPITSDTWINSRPLGKTELEGKVVLVEFWTFACRNCRNVEPYVKAWHSAFGGRGLVVIGVHSPEFPHEADLANVRRYIEERGIRSPVAIDNDFSNWDRYGNRYWPAIYLVDRKGIIRYVHTGEGAYDRTERTIRELLTEQPGRPEPGGGTR